MLEIKNLHVEIEGKEILKGVNLKLEKGKIHALMGPNGSGKSTLANVIMGHPKYTVTQGKILLNNEDITNASPDERAKKGLFLSFQYPSEISGITIMNFLRTALNNVKEKKMTVFEFQKFLKEKLKLLKIDESFAERYLNAGFSGGEKKKSEILQLAVLDPTIALLDETDSGLDIDALKTIAEGINNVMDKNKEILIITHYKRILEYIQPDTLSIMINGKIVMEGGKELVDQLEAKGYGWIENGV
ncbi:Fe-S cluster assembly ATPase SufC [Candidatus Pacearchaeota archaeon]|nr:Fe-S cluster assembly ATPase SufC [Candidatus Pacearchaeota archaeon]